MKLALITWDEATYKNRCELDEGEQRRLLGALRLRCNNSEADNDLYEKVRKYIRGLENGG